MFNGKFAVLGAATLSLALSSVLSATTPPPPAPLADVYQANYFLGVYGGPADATITIMDTGANGSANLCADIYVLNPSEELEECCSCVLTPDEILSGSVFSNLLSNGLTSIDLTNGVIKIISDSKCNAAKPTATPEMVAWLTRLDFSTFPPSGPNSVGVTTTQFASAGLSAGELASLGTRCGDITLIGSGHGVCQCPSEPPNNYSE